jgi:HYDIN/CFA65/VesB-like, Ig-like domain
MVGKRSRGRVRVCRAVWFSTAVLCFAVSPAHSTETKSGTTIRRAKDAKAASSAAMQADSPKTLPLEVTPSEVQFSEVPVGEMSSQMLRVTNTGEALLQIKGIVAPAEFRVVGQVLPFVVAQGTSANITISYRPKGEGAVAGRVLIYTSERREPLELKLTASAIQAQEELAASVVSVDFADVAVGSREAKEVSVTNTGSVDATIASVTSEGEGFAVSGANTRLGAGQTMSLAVSFTPRNAGTRSGTLRVATTSGVDGLEIALNATGVTGSQRVVRLQWENDSKSEARYAVYRAADATGPYEQIAAAVSVPEYIDSGLAVGHTYYYVVAPVATDETEGEYSEPISATVPEG